MKAEPSCSAFEKSMDAFQPLDVSLTLIDGNFRFLPEGCFSDEDGKDFLQANSFMLSSAGHCGESQVGYEDGTSNRHQLKPQHTI